MSDSTHVTPPVDSHAAPPARRQPQPGDVLDGTYRLDEQLGKGGVGIVFKAWHMHLQRPCAVKLLHPQLVSNEELRTRFRREAQSAFQLGNPHIVAITDFRDDPNAWPYIVMELVVGQTLRDRLESGPLPPSLAVRMMMQLCDALMTAHRRGVIHRDLKPENLFLARVDAPAAGEPDVTLKVLDFGLSKLLDAMEITGTGRLLGSPSYMSPEQARGDSHQVDARSDIFAVGVLLYECLTGEKLFNEEDFEQKRQQIIEARLPPLGLVERGLPLQLEKVIQRACARLPEERYQSAQSLQNALVAVTAAAARASGQQHEAPVRRSPEISSTVSSVGGGELVAAPGASTQSAGQLAGQPARRSALAPLSLGLAALALCGMGYAGYTVLHAGRPGVPAALATDTTPPAATLPAPTEPPKEPAREPDKKPEPAAVTPPATATATEPAAGKDDPTDKPADKLPDEVKAAATEPGKVSPTATAHAPVGVAGTPTAVKPVAWKGARPLRPITTAPAGVKPPPLPTEDAAPTTQAAALSVNAVMRRAMGSVARCFPEGGAPPKVSVDVTVVAGGKVSEVSSEGADDQAGCVAGVVKGLRFAPPTDSDSYSVRYDFVNLGLLKR
ncbi:MAG: protein kinase [Polyangia bacterium]